MDVAHTDGDNDWFPAAQSRASRIAYRCCRFIVTWFIRLFTRMVIDGREHVPAHGAFVLAPVHRSYVDTPIAACVTARRMRFMGKDSLWKYRWFGWVAYMLGAFPVRRGTADREAYRRSMAVLQGGEPLVLFPEGERKSGPVVQPLFDGAVYLAIKTGVPIVPVGIGGSERVMPKGARLIYPRRVHVIVGAPLEPPIEAGGRIPRSVIRDQSARLHAELQQLFDTAQQRARR
jgi:1-acyl-sn-glycerol-3-phosphate acyltransferase